MSEEHFDRFLHFSLNQIKKNRPYSLLDEHLNHVACAFLAVSLLQTSLPQMNCCSASTGNKRKPLVAAASGWKLKWEILACKCNISRRLRPRELGNFVTHLGNYTYPAKWVIHSNPSGRRYTLFIVAVFARISRTFNATNGFMGARHAKTENASEEMEANSSASGSS